jgi:hypothetical protein
MAMTFKQIMERIQRYNNGTRAVRRDFYSQEIGCVYQTADGNRCAIGCFIPDGHRALGFSGNVVSFFFEDDSDHGLFPDLLEHMPSTDTFWLGEFQRQHDNGNDDGTLHHALHLWLSLNPPPDAPASYFD